MSASLLAVFCIHKQGSRTPFFNTHPLIQRKFREEHDEESYFEDDDDDDVGPQPLPPSNTSVPLAVDEVAAQEDEGQLQGTGRDFALAQNSLMNHTGPQLRPEDHATNENVKNEEAHPVEEQADANTP